MSGTGTCLLFDTAGGPLASPSSAGVQTLPSIGCNIPLLRNRFMYLQTIAAVAAIDIFHVQEKNEAKRVCVK